jgi:hypothetical protein
VSVKMLVFHIAAAGQNSVVLIGWYIFVSNE